MQFPIYIELHRSRFLAVFLLLFHILAAACVIALPWPWLTRSLLLAMIGASLWRSLRAEEILGLHLSERGGLSCVFRDDVRATAVVLPDSAVFNHLIVLRMRIADSRCVRSLALLPDSMSPEQFRVLRLWLRWRGDAVPR